MKIIKQIIPGLAIILLVSCSQRNALDFNNKLVAIQQELMGKFSTMHTDDTAINIKTVAMLIDVQDFAKQKLDEVKGMQAPKGGEAFKEAMVNDLSGIIDSYSVLIKITEARNDEAKLAPLREDFAVWEKKLETLDDNVLEEQRKFAKANNIMLK